jgi:predicted secreted Zn-dependent protease
VDVASIRQLGREAGNLIAREDRQAEVTLLVAAQPLALIVMRYEMWASAPTQIVSVKVSYADNGITGFVDQFSAAQRTGPLVGLTEASPRCGFYVDGARADLLPTSKMSADCRSLLSQVIERSSTSKSTSTK